MLTVLEKDGSSRVLLSPMQIDPSGSTTLEAWHPTLGAKTLRVTIGKGAKAKVTARIGYKP